MNLIKDMTIIFCLLAWAGSMVHDFTESFDSSSQKTSTKEQHREHKHATNSAVPSVSNPEACDSNCHHNVKFHICNTCLCNIIIKKDRIVFAASSYEWNNFFHIEVFTSVLLPMDPRPPAYFIA